MRPPRSRVRFSHRRHHCRGCGHLFCANCSSRRIPLPHSGYDKPVRSCADCATPSIRHASAVPTSGGEVILDVENLRPGAITIKLDGRPCGAISLLPSARGGLSRVRCSVPAGMGKDRVLTLRTEDGLSTTCAFTYAAPEIHHCQRAPTAGGAVSITGANLGTDPGQVELFVGRAAEAAHAGDAAVEPNCEVAGIARGHISARCEVPPGNGANLCMYVRVGGVGSALVNTLTYEAPEITTVHFLRELVPYDDTAGNSAVEGNALAGDRGASTDDRGLGSLAANLVISGVNFGASSGAIGLSVRAVRAATDDAKGARGAQSSARSALESKGGGDTGDIMVHQFDVVEAHSRIVCQIPLRALEAFITEARASGGTSGRGGASSAIGAGDLDAVTDAIGFGFSGVVELTVAIEVGGNGGEGTGTGPGTAARAGGMGGAAAMGAEKKSDGNNEQRAKFGPTRVSVPLPPPPQHRQTSAGRRWGQAKSGRGGAGGKQGGTTSNSSTPRHQHGQSPSLDFSPTSSTPGSMGVSPRPTAHSAPRDGYSVDFRSLSMASDLAPWTPDAAASRCCNPSCGSRFSFAVRKHHCRACGQVFCGKCSSGRDEVPGYSGLVRVCDECSSDNQRKMRAAAVRNITSVLAALDATDVRELQHELERIVLTTQGKMLLLRGPATPAGADGGADDAVLSINASASPNPALSPGSSSTPVAAGPVNRVPGFGGSPSRAPARPSAEFSPVQHQQRSVAM